MARDLNRIMEDVRNAREVFVTEDGRIEDATEAEENETSESSEGRPRARTRLKPEIFGDMPTVRVTTGVLDAMHAEASRFPGETGGLVIGPEDGTVSEIIPSGPDADRTPSSFQLDAAYLQPLLERAEDSGKRFLGIWHVHPSGLGQLSSTDHRAATSILSDPDWNVSQLILPLSVRSGAGFHTEFFVAHLDRGRLRVRSARVTIASGPAKTRRPRAIAGGRIESCSERLATDCHALRNAGWFCSLKALSPKDLVLTASRNGVELLLFVPPEYPLSPPEVMAADGHGLVTVPFEQLPETDRWSSRRSLLEVVEQAEAFTREHVNIRHNVFRRVASRLWQKRSARQLQAQEG